MIGAIKKLKSQDASIDMEGLATGATVGCLLTTNICMIAGNASLEDCKKFNRLLVAEFEKEIIFGASIEAIKKAKALERENE